VTVALKRRSNAELLIEVERLPENMTGEVIDGELHVMGRPSIAHQNVETEVSADLRRSGGGPGGWLIVPEVEVRFPTDELVVPDLSGWRRERIAGRESENPALVRPDWVCEILSDSTRLKDLGPKRDLYARQGVPHLWVIDPLAHILEAFALERARWVLLGMWSEAQVAVGIEPFPDGRFELARWWL
jgi:Uma2 family endonuclease